LFKVLNKVVGLMLKQDAINFFGTKTKVARAAGVGRSAVSQWGLLVPEGKASRLARASGNALHYDPAIYDQHKAKRLKELNHENQQLP